MSISQHFLFRPIDSWFFRESRSMDGSGATALDSIFPPANNTLLGALRTQIGNQYHAKHNTSWQEFKSNTELQKIIGIGNNYAQLKAQGTWLYHAVEKQLYFPLPMSVVAQGKSDKDKENTTEEQYDFFNFSAKPIRCDLGKICLPELKKRGGDERDAPIENAYISAKEMTKVLQGQPPINIIKQADILRFEHRLGIERDNQRHQTVDGKFYQTKHLRLLDNWQLYLGLEGADCPLPETLLRLGGEARMAALQTLDNAPALPQKPIATANTTHLMLYLLTPLPDFARENNQPVLPNASFTPNQQNDLTIWEGQLNDMDINIISAITGKSERIGGWDMANHQSLPVRSFIPAGSCWYLETDNAQAIIDALHGKFITTDNDRALGYGQVVVGLAPNI